MEDASPASMPKKQQEEVTTVPVTDKENIRMDCGSTAREAASALKCGQDSSETAGESKGGMPSDQLNSTAMKTETMNEDHSKGEAHKHLVPTKGGFAENDPVPKPSLKQEPDNGENVQEVDEDESENEATTLEDVLGALDDLDTPGSTCTGGIATDLPTMPGLSVQGVGAVPLPITEQTAIALKSVAKQAPHGRGMETVVDTSVRNSLEIDADQVTLDNPRWNSSLRKVVDKAATALGVAPNLVEPYPYKLLLYETGGFFKKHRDTEKEDGMFATLVIQLPSVFKGGAFLVSHGGRTKSFMFDNPSDSPYFCHFEAHYADCEHEILPIESGYRLALIYSLCYTGAPQTSPSAAAMIQGGGLVTAMESLPPESSLFAVPLNHQYTTKSLARLGVGALKGSDRSLAQTISHAQEWKSIIVQVTRLDHEMLSGSHRYGFDVEDSEKGDPEFESIYDENGADAGAHSSWLHSQLELTSVDDGGMVLASEDEVDDMWSGEGGAGEVEFTGNAGVTRDTTYSTCLLVVFSNASVFERICQSCIHDGVKQVVEDPSLMPRLLVYLQRDEAAVISNKNFVELHGVIRPNLSSAVDDPYWTQLAVLVNCLRKSEPPTAEVMSIFASLIHENGWNDKISPIRLLLEGLPARPEAMRFTGFFDAANALLTIQTMGEGSPDTIRGLLQELLDAFQKAPTRTTTSTFSSYRYRGYQLEWDASRIADKLAVLALKHSWSSVSPIVKLCFRKARKVQGNSGACLSDVLVAMADLQSRVPDANLDDLRCDVLTSSVALLVAPQGVSLWSSPKADTIVRDLCRFGLESHLRVLQEWAASAVLQVLSQVHSVLQKVNISGDVWRSPVAKDAFVKTVGDRWKFLRAGELGQKKAKLERLVRKGRPTFTWRMPHANTSNATLDTFLMSENQGPTRIVVGGGINNARRLARQLSYNRGYGASNSSCRDKGYSAVIKNSDDWGQDASLIVTKTDEWYHTQLAQYESNFKKLGEVQAELQALVGTEETRPALKRARTEVEVIEID